MGGGARRPRETRARRRLATALLLSLAAHALAMQGARALRGTPGLDVPHVGRSDWAFTSELVEPPPGLFDANFRPVPARERRPRVRTRVELVALWVP